MDWLQFISSVIGHLAWPSVIIVLLVLLRQHIGALAERIEEFSFGGAKFVWKKKLAEGASIIEHEPQPQVTAPAQEQLKPPVERPPGDQRREDIAREFTRRRVMAREALRKSSFGKVIAGLEEVDEILFEIGDKMGVDAAAASSVMYSLMAHGNVPPSIGKLYDTLRDARNLIAHSPTLPDEEEATEYLRQIDFLKSTLSHLNDLTPDLPDSERKSA